MIWECRAELLHLLVPTLPNNVLLAHANHPAFHDGIIGAVGYAINVGNIDRLPLSVQGDKVKNNH